MIEKWLEMLAGFIVDALCNKVGIHTPADAEAVIARVIRAELPDMSKIEDIPNQVGSQLSGVVTLLNALPAQLIAAVKGLIPRFPGL